MHLSQELFTTDNGEGTIYKQILRENSKVMALAQMGTAIKQHLYLVTDLI